MAVLPILSPRRELRLRWAVPLLLALLTACIWCLQNRRIDAEAWQHPLALTGDSMEILVRFKAVSEGELLPFLPQNLERLGAPFGASWNEYPVADKLLFLVFGNIARLTGVNAASNLAVMMAAVTAALAFYGCARFLRVRRLWCFSAALLFAFTYQSAQRGLPHLWLAYSYTVPLALLTSWLLAASSRPRWTNREGLFCLGTAAIIGASNPYNLFLFLQLIALAFAANTFNPQRRKHLVFTAACGFAAVASWALFQCETWIYPTGEKAAPLIVRNYSGTELYGLKPVELAVPPADHHSALFASIAHRYSRWAAFKGETSFPYLGIIGVAGLLWIFIDLARRLAARSKKRIPAHGLQIGWILLYSAPGGINGFLALFLGLQIFRATNRYSIFISALVLFFLAAQVSRLSRAWPRILQGGCAFCLVLFGLWDEIPFQTSREFYATVQRQTDSDAVLGRSLEAALPARACVFQIPVEEFPESPPTNGMPEYEHFRPYLNTRTLRFSYGTLKERAQSQWLLDAAQLEVPELVSSLENNGFAALFVDRRGYPDRGQKLQATLRQLDRPLIGESDDFFVVKLHPASHPQPPLARTLTFGRGWYATESDERWAYEDATCSFYNPWQKPLALSLAFDLRSPDSRTFSLLLNGALVATQTIGPNTTRLSLQNVVLKPGLNCFSLTSDRPPVRVHEARYGLHAFSVSNAVLSASPANATP